jgi:arabinogalactan oligomer/maltooligosaccharide transport system permease protein
MVNFGVAYLGKLNTLGTIETYREGRKTVYGDNSFFILLYGVLTLFFVLAFLYTWYMNVKQNRVSEQILKSGKKLKSTKDDLKSLMDEQFHKTLLALPTLGVTVFTILPIFFMILVAFTNFDATHQPPSKLFTWVGWDNFRQLLSSDNASYGNTFSRVLLWTLIWAFFATFLNYFLGMGVAILINKKGVKLKKLWRTILVMTIAVPQFVSLLYVGKMFASDGLVNSYLIKWGIIEKAIPFWTNPTYARILIIVINLWIGIPYMMLIATGLLMNIPADLYESARIDGANQFQMFMKITLPYMLFVTGPFLLTSFIGNLNNFNVIFLLNQGQPQSMKLTGGAGYTDLLVTWLYKMTINDTNYKMAAVIGIMVFLVTAVISLVVYNFLPSVKDEEGFQ